MKVYSVVLVLATICLGSADGAPSGAPSCADLEGVKPPAQMEYLQRERSTLKADCILYAIDQIGLKRYAAATQDSDQVPRLSGA